MREGGGARGGRDARGGEAGGAREARGRAREGARLSDGPPDARDGCRLPAVGRERRDGEAAVPYRGHVPADATARSLGLPYGGAAGCYGTTVTGHLPALTSRTATDPTIRCPACSEAPTTTASALSSSAAFTRPL